AGRGRRPPPVPVRPGARPEAGGAAGHGDPDGRRDRAAGTGDIRGAGGRGGLRGRARGPAPVASGPGGPARRGRDGPPGDMAAHPDVTVRRIYEPLEDDAGRARVLVDRLWPRGVARATAGIDEWAKDAAPSTELRRWYGHD